jgi:hypothetical protein
MNDYVTLRKVNQAIKREPVQHTLSVMSFMAGSLFLAFFNGAEDGYAVV